MTRTLRWLAASALTLCCSVMCLGQVPDGGVKVSGGGKSLDITSLSSAQMFSSCTENPSADTVFDCNLFGGAQEIFAGINETGVAWNSLSLVLAGYNSTADPTVNCDTNAAFADCSVAVSGSNLIVDFSQGNGTGVGCVFGVNSCGENSLAAFINDLNPKNPLLPYNNPFGCILPGSVCGSPEFVIGVGPDDQAFNVALSPNFGLGANGTTPPTPLPEPSTWVLLAGAALALLVLGTRKAILL